MNKTFKKILSVCCTVVTTLTATLFRSTEVRADNTYKIVFIGDEQVGKTQLVNGIVGDKFSDDYKCTIGADLKSIQPTINEKLQLWDTAGQQVYRAYMTHYYQEAHVMLYCCSCAKIASQSQQNLKESFGIPANSPVMLCITKTDEVNQSDYKDTNEFKKEKLQEILTQFQKANAECNILPKILVTSAKENQYKFCEPAHYDSTECKNIYPNLANDLVDLCKGQEPTRKNVNAGRKGKMCEDSDAAGKAGTTTNTRLADIDSNSDGMKPKLRMGYCLGLPTSLVSLGLLGGLGCYYGHDRHRKKNKENHPKEKYIQQEKKRITKKLLVNEPL